MRILYVKGNLAEKWGMLDGKLREGCVWIAVDVIITHCNEAYVQKLLDALSLRRGSTPQEKPFKIFRRSVGYYSCLFHLRVNSRKRL
jgi:hypothetical protein